MASASSSSFLNVPASPSRGDDRPGTPTNQRPSDPERGREDDENNEDDDDATIGVRTPRLGSTPLSDPEPSASSSPYSSAAHNASQQTITLTPPSTSTPSHTYISLGSHQALEQPPSSPGALPVDSPPQPSVLSTAATSIINSLKSFYTGLGASSPASTPSQQLSSFALFTLTLALAGAQLTWTLELAYGNIFLLSLGLSKPHSALVWLAGPASGLIAQPLIGALSDSITPDSRWRPIRRRVFLASSAAILTLSTLLLAFVQPCARFVVDAILRVGEADWDPDRKRAVESTTKFLAILAFWILDLALNGLQASARVLILDVAPRQQQSQANAWHGRMTHAGNVLGYAAGWADLGSALPFLDWLGGGQFRKLAILSLVGMLVCVTVTCVCTSEPVPSSAAGREQEHDQEALSWSSPRVSHSSPNGAAAGETPGSSVSQRRSGRTNPGRRQNDDIESSRSAQRQRSTSAGGRKRPTPSSRGGRDSHRKPRKLPSVLSHIWRSTKTLPKPIARVCIVQLFAFSSWFPFLFFSTTYLVEIVARSHALFAWASGNGGGSEDDKESEKGSFAMMCYAIVSLVAGGLLPYLAIAAQAQRTEEQKRKREEERRLEEKKAKAAKALTEDTAGESGLLPPPAIETAGGTVIYQRSPRASLLEAGPSTPPSQPKPTSPTALNYEGRAVYTSFSDPDLRRSGGVKSPTYADAEAGEQDDDEVTPLLSGSSGHRRGSGVGWTKTADMGLSLRTVWTIGCVLSFILLTIGTFLVPFLPNTVARGDDLWLQKAGQEGGERRDSARVIAAMVLVAAMGIPWAIASWVPFALVGEFLKEDEDRREQEESLREAEEREGGGSGARMRGTISPIRSESGSAGGRAGVRESLLNCAPLGTTSSSSASGNGSPSRSQRDQHQDFPPRPIRPRRSPSDLLPNEVSPEFHSSSEDEDDESEDEQARRKHSRQISEEVDGLRILPTSEAYQRRLEEEEVRRAHRQRREEARDREREAGSDGKNKRRSWRSDDAGEHENGTGRGKGRYRDGRREDDDHDEDGDGYKRGEASAGTVLGIHNLAIVMPQFFVALIANIILSLTDKSGDGVVWVLRFGGVMALLAGVATRFVPLTQIEKEVIRRKKEHARGDGDVLPRQRGNSRSGNGIGSAGNRALPRIS